MASKGRRYIGWGHWDELAKETGIKRKSAQKKADPAKLKKRKQFAKCPKCGGQMTFLPETNILICENEVEKKFTKKNEDGTTTEEVKRAVCGYVNYVAKRYVGYLNYLFQD